MGCCCAKSNSTKQLQMLKKELVSTIPNYSFTSSALDVNLKINLASCRLSEFKYRRKIGTGRYGNVYLVTERRSGTKLAMKEVNRKHEIYSLEPCLERENVILCQIKSPWLMEMIQSFETHTRLFMLLELLPGPTLVKIAKRKSISPVVIRTYIAEMLMAVQAVHHYGYMHRDIKLSNFLLNGYGHVKLCDFGTCVRFLPWETARRVFPLRDNFCQLPPGEMCQHRRRILQKNIIYKPIVPHGTSYYCAPEVIQLATDRPTVVPYTYLCDYWSLGVCFYYLLFGKLPFYDDEKIRVPSLILNWPRTLKFPKSNNKFGHAALVLVKGLLRGEKSRLGRNGIYDVASKEFFNESDWTVIHQLNEYYRDHSTADKQFGNKLSPFSGRKPMGRRKQQSTFLKQNLSTNGGKPILLSTAVSLACRTSALLRPPSIVYTARNSGSAAGNADNTYGSVNGQDQVDVSA